MCGFCGQSRKVVMSVAVTDITTAEAFQIEVRAGERALDVFHHPYAYAAWHGVRLPTAPDRLMRPRRLSARHEVDWLGF
jgi:hypothetical protein